MHQIYVVDTTIFNEPNTNTLHRYVMYMVGNITYQIVLLVHSMLVHLWSKMTSKPHPNAQRYKMYFLTVYMLNRLKSGKSAI